LFDKLTIWAIFMVIAAFFGRRYYINDLQ